MSVISSNDSEKWQRQLANMIRTPEDLLEQLELDRDWLAGGLIGHEAFEVRVPRPFLNRIEKGNPNDPLLRQVLPLAEEGQLQVPGYSYDPLEEQAANAGKGLIHKYTSRVLLIVSGACAVNCRYCFRRHFPYQDNNPSSQEWQQVLDQIRQDKNINEVILSGGDPLSVNDKRLKYLIERIADIPHISRLRIHTRLPIVIPSRVTPELINILASSRLNSVVVIHANHANEFDLEVDEALNRLKLAGIQLLNQSVMLAGVNDSVEAMAKLSERMFQAGVLPYYVHLLDQVIGTAHFEVPEKRAKQIMGELLSHLPGFLVPKLVREVAGQPSKTPVSPVPPLT